MRIFLRLTNLFKKEMRIFRVLSILTFNVWKFVGRNFVKISFSVFDVSRFEFPFDTRLDISKRVVEKGIIF